MPQTPNNFPNKQLTNGSERAPQKGSCPPRKVPLSVGGPTEKSPKKRSPGEKSPLRSPGEGHEGSQQPGPDVSILSPPDTVPPDMGPSPPTSEGVWFTEGPEDLLLSKGRALRMSCKVNARAPYG